MNQDTEALVYYQVDSVMCSEFLACSEFVACCELSVFSAG